MDEHFLEAMDRLDIPVFELTGDKQVKRIAPREFWVRLDGEPSQILWSQKVGTLLVSTVFLRLCEWMGGQFETAVFDDKRGMIELRRAQTFLAARLQHHTVVSAILERRPPERLG